KEKHGVWYEPDPHTRCKVSPENLSAALEYFTKDELQCSRQGPNQKDVISVMLHVEIKFKLSWIEDGSIRDQASNYLKTELASVTSGATADVAVLFSTRRFFSHSGNRPFSPEAQDELSRYLLVPVDHPLSQMKSFEGLHRLFLKYNTAVPSSASVERLFSVANEVLTKKRARLADSNIEKTTSC
ncbi:hypothetical protein HPB47_003423, partial [Ixodes persulcatus]